VSRPPWTTGRARLLPRARPHILAAHLACSAGCAPASFDHTAWRLLRARDRGSRTRGLGGALAADSPPKARPAATSGGRASRIARTQRGAPRTTSTSGAPLSSPTRFSIASQSSRCASAPSASPCTGVCACVAPSPHSRQISSSAGESALHCPARARSRSKRRRHQYTRPPSRS
jgi:hypothetical protein